MGGGFQMIKKEEGTSQIYKIVYFDEDSVTDYVQIVAGGKLEKTTELLNEKGKSASAGTSASISGGISGVFRALLGFEIKAEADAEMGISLNTNRMVKNILKNTILTDFINLMETKDGIIKKFQGYKITAEKDSLSYIIMISPYMTMLRGGKGLEAGDFNISIDRIDNAIKMGKGYYEFIGEKENECIVLRFNINSFKNNYKISDLLKMDLTIYAIKVGKTSLGQLNINNELSLDENLTIKKDNPSYSKTDVRESSNIDVDAELEVFDVLLAGVEKHD